jgi:hypothetical protein
VIATTLAGLFPPHQPDPRIPPAEGSPFGTPLPDPWNQPAPYRVKSALEEEEKKRAAP